MLTNQKILVAKEESNYGVDSSPTGSNAINARNIKVNDLGDLLETNYVGSTLSPSQPKIGKRWTEVTFEVDVKGSGSAGTAPEIGDLLEACGFTETVTAGSSVVYTPRSSSMKSVTLKVYEINEAVANNASAVLRTITGARGNAVFTIEAGQLAKIAFSFRGKYNAPADAATITPTYQSTTAPTVESGSYSLNGVTSLVVQQQAIDLGNELSDVDDISAANALKEVRITGRRPTGSFNPEAVTVATYDFRADWIAATARALSLVVGTVAGNKCTITAPKVTLDSISDGDLNGRLTRDIPVHFNRNSGDDELVLNFA